MPEELTYEKVEKLILDFLDGLVKTPDERVEIVDDFIHRLNFERRLTLLTDLERQNLCDEELTEKERKVLDGLKSDPKTFEEKIQSFARARYFRRCAWVDYLNGITDEKPSFSSPA